MIKRYSILISILILLAINLNCYAQQSVYFCPEFNNKEQAEFLLKNNVPLVTIIYQDQIISDKTGKLDRNNLYKAINKLIPDKNATGIGVLDWEGKQLLIMLNEINFTDNEYLTTIYNYTEAINYAKLLRPKMKWGLYNYNTSSYPKVKLRNRKIVEKTIPLLKELDFLAPSMYLQDKRSTKNQKMIEEFVDSNISFSIELGLNLKKPVYVFVWNRYHNVKAINDLIEEKNFSWYVDRIMNFTYNNKKIDGIIWWNCENYLLKTKANFAIKEYKHINNQSDLLQRYWDIIKKYNIKIN